MKKWMLSVAIVSALALGACGDEGKGTAEKEVKEETVESVQLTVPSTFFDGLTEEEIFQNANDQGFENFKLNEDGSGSFEMERTAHKKMLKDFKSNIAASYEELTDGEQYPSLKEITYNDDFTVYQLTVDREQFDNGFDSMAKFALIMGSTYYNILNGVAEADLKVQFDIIDEATNEVYESSVYPDDLDDSLH